MGGKKHVCWLEASIVCFWFFWHWVWHYAGILSMLMLISGNRKKRSRRHIAFIPPNNGLFQEKRITVTMKTQENGTRGKHRLSCRTMHRFYYLFPVSITLHKFFGKIMTCTKPLMKPVTKR